MATYCPRCGSFNGGQGQACLTCLGPLAMGQSVPSDARCATHPDQSPLGRCMGCGKATCFECGSMMDGKILCFACATAALTTTASSAAAPSVTTKKASRGKKK